jgi:hypothetical protein
MVMEIEVIIRTDTATDMAKERTEESSPGTAPVGFDQEEKGCAQHREPKDAHETGQGQETRGDDQTEAKQTQFL